MVREAILQTYPPDYILHVVKAFLVVTKCYHCHKKGHVMADCWYLKRPLQDSTPKGSLMTMQTGKGCQSDLNTTNGASNQSIPAEYHPFISSGHVCLPDSDIEVPVTILRDTGANQTLDFRWCTAVLQIHIYRR